MKVFFVVLAVVAFSLFTVTLVRAEEAAEKKEEIKKLEVSLEVGVANKYVDSITGEEYSSKPELRQKLTAVFYEKYFAVIENFVSPSYHLGSDPIKEIDFWAGGVIKAGEKIEIETAIGYFNLFGFNRIRGDLFGIYIKPSYKLNEKISVFVWLEHDFATDKKILPGGTIWQLGATWSPIEHLALEPSIVGHDNAYGYRPEPVSVVKVKAAYTFELWGAEIIPDITLQKRLGRSLANGGMTKDNVYGGLTVAIPLYKK